MASNDAGGSGAWDFLVEEWSTLSYAYGHGCDFWASHVPCCIFASTCLLPSGTAISASQHILHVCFLVKAGFAISAHQTPAKMMSGAAAGRFSALLPLRSCLQIQCLCFLQPMAALVVLLSMRAQLAAQLRCNNVYILHFCPFKPFLTVAGTGAASTFCGKVAPFPSAAACGGCWGTCRCRRLGRSWRLCASSLAAAASARRCRR